MKISAMILDILNRVDEMRQVLRDGMWPLNERLCLRYLIASAVFENLYNYSPILCGGIIAQ